VVKVKQASKGVQKKRPCKGKKSPRHLNREEKPSHWGKPKKWGRDEPKRPQKAVLVASIARTAGSKEICKKTQGEKALKRRTQHSQNPRWTDDNKKGQN